MTRKIPCHFFINFIFIYNILIVIMSNTVTIDKNKYYMVEVRRREGENGSDGNILILTIDVGEIFTIDNDKFYETYNEYVQDFNLMKSRNNYNTNITNTISTQIQRREDCNIYMFLENQEYDAFRVELPYDADANYRKSLCDTIYKTIKNIVE